MRATFSDGYDQRTDAQLIEAFYRGEDIALSMLSERLRPQLTRFAISRLPVSEVGRYQLAEDLVQDAIIKVALTKDRFQSRWRSGKSTVSTWIGTILKNLIHSHLRTRKNRIRVTTDLCPDTRSDACDLIEKNMIDYRCSQDTECESQEQKSWLQAISQLPQELHLLVTMQLEGKSHREIATELGMSRSTVTYRIKNATTQLRRMTAA